MKRRTILAFTLKVVGVLASFTYSWLASRVVGALGMGEYQTALTIALIGSAVAGLGMNNAVLRLVAANMAIVNEEKAIAIYYQAVRYVGGSAGFLTILIYLTADFVLGSFFPEQQKLGPLIKLICWGILPLALTGLLVESLKALGKFQLSLLLQGFMPAMLGIISIGMGWALGIISVPVLIGIYVLSLYLTCLLGFYWVAIYKPKYKQTSAGHQGDLLASAMPLWGVALSSVVMENIDILLLGFMVNFEAVGVYAIAKKVAGVNAFLLSSVNTVTAPQFARLYAQDKHSELQEVAQQSTRFLFWMGLGSLACLSLFAKLILGLFGPVFEIGWPLLVILSVGQFINVATGSVGYLLMMTGNEGIFRQNVLMSSVMTVALYILLIPPFSATGAAVASALGLAFQNGRAYWLVFKRLGFLTLNVKI